MKRTTLPVVVVAATLVLVVAGSVSTGYAERVISRLKGPNPSVTLSEDDGEKSPAQREEDIRFDLMSPMGRLAHLSATGRLDEAIGRAREGGLRKLSAESVAEGEPADEIEGPAGGQAETSIAVDSTGMHVVIGINDTRGFALNPVSVSGFLYSDDGGTTFTDGGQLPSPGSDMIGATKLPQIFGDPEVEYLGGSTFIYFSIMVKKFSATTAAQTMCVHRSTDYGHTWSGPFEVPPATNPNGLVSPTTGAPRDSADKEFADRDPDTGRVLLSWSNFTLTSIAPGGVEISATYSDDIATASPPTWSARRVIAATAADGQASNPRFAGNGSPNAYIGWRRFPGGNNQNVGFVRSTDNGMTWSAPVNTTTNFFTMDFVLGNDRVNTSPGMAVDTSGGLSDGSIYTVFANNNGHDGADIAFQRSTDGGLTFSAPILLDSRPGSDRAQWFPWANVDTTTGRVYVSYYDQGIADTGHLTEYTYLYSDDGGTTWSKPMPLTDRPFKAGWGNNTGQPNLGDYNQGVAQGGELFVTWAGTELKGLLDQQPTGNFSTPDAFFKRAPTAKTSVDLRTVTFTESGGNGFLDPGDTVQLTMPLRNYDTNPLHSGAVTGITGTLSTSTPGVVVATAVSTYPDLAPGASASNTTSYVLQLSQSFVPGTHIELALAVSSLQGPNTLLFTQATGTPGTTLIFSENFNGVAPGSLPAGWTAIHGGGANTVPWTTNNTFKGTSSNAAFHINANDGVGGTGNPTRFERLATPTFTVPSNAEWVTVDMDVAYDTEDDPSFNILAYDGFLLRATDFTPGRVAIATLAEAIEEEFTTGAIQHYPKHQPRNSSAAYFPNGDMSMWAGDSGTFQHVRIKLPGPGGLAGASIQLRFEYAQDSNSTCANVRPGHSCGVMFDNLVVQSGVSLEADVAIWIGLKNSDDVGTNFDLKAELYRNGSLFGTGQVDNVPGGSSGFNNAILRAFNLALSSTNAVFGPGDTLSLKLSVRAGATGHRSGTARLWYNDSQANSRLHFAMGASATDYYLLDGFVLGTSPGPGPKKTIDVTVNRAVGGNPFKPFGTWTKTF